MRGTYVGGTEVRQATPLGADTRVSSPPRGARLRAQARFGIALLLTLSGLALWLRSGLAVPPITYLAGPLPVLVAFIATIMYAAIGLSITLQRPEVRTGRILAWVAMIQGVRDLAWGYLALAVSSPTPMPIDPAMLAWLNYALTIPLVGALLVTLGVIFPTDRPESGAGWRVAGTAFVGGSLVLLGTVFRPGPIAFVPTLHNPLGPAGPEPLARTLQLIGYTILVVTAGLAAMLVVTRYRHADAATRAQLRVFAGSTLILAATFALLIVTSLAGLGTAAARDLIAMVFFVATALVPVAVLVAVARYRLYEIDRLVSRGFINGALVAILAGLSVAAVQLFTALFKALTGETSDAVLILTTLLLVSVFTPIKTRLETAAKRLTGDPAATSSGPAAIGAADAFPRVPADLGDPAFLAALDARISAIVDRRVATVRRARRHRPGRANARPGVDPEASERRRVA